MSASIDRRFIIVSEKANVLLATFAVSSGESVEDRCRATMTALGCRVILGNRTFSAYHYAILEVPADRCDFDLGDVHVGSISSGQLFADFRKFEIVLTAIRADGIRLVN